MLPELLGDDGMLLPPVFDGLVPAPGVELPGLVTEPLPDPPPELEAPLLPELLPAPPMPELPPAPEPAPMPELPPVLEPPLMSELPLAPPALSELVG